ncbi:MAG: hypothetical protein NC124_02115 [Clostridium sp.]|nr:hypothetical protein [Clostridium sp.]
MNVVKLTNLDFEPPYKAEFFRIAGIYVPIGGLIGWIDIGEENDQEKTGL